MPDRAQLVAIALFTLAPCALAAQASTSDCASRPPYFEFQVEVPARFLPDSSDVRSDGLRPGGLGAGRDTLVVQFLVDTLGRPVIASFKALKTPSREAGARARAAVEQWRFTPARTGGCTVRQLVQTSVGR